MVDDEFSVCNKDILYNPELNSKEGERGSFQLMTFNTMIELLLETAQLQVECHWIELA